MVLLFVALTILLGWVAWKSTDRLRPTTRFAVVSCRVLLGMALLVFALNPGRWIESGEETTLFWSVLADNSQSMDTKDAPGDLSRWETATKLASQTLEGTDSPNQADFFAFHADLIPVEEKEFSSLSPDGEQTDLVEAADSLLTLARNRSGKFKGSIVISDGRQTIKTPDMERIALRARASESPFYILPVGGEVKPVDLILESTRRQFVAFAGQETTVSARVSAQGLGPVRPVIELHGPQGEEIETRQIELSGDEEREVRFTFPALPAGVHLLEFRTSEWPGERVTSNNSQSFTLTVLDGTTKIFMAEGVPYWDSKFLAQMIRNQKNMDITSVYRLASDRFFRVATGDERPAEESGNIFPASMEDLSQYDIIVFGKGAEYFLDESRLALLNEYVRDRGGAVLFTRGKPYRSTFEGLEFLEPATWGDRIRQPLTPQPTSSGEAAGLFGDLLPGIGDPVWQELPSLQESYQCLELKSFTEVLLEGRWSLDGKEQTVPLLMSRRFGRGMTVMLNADGLWHWDFFPSDRGVEGQYEEFWGQLIQWAITFSEFLPGQDLSLNLDQSVVRPGELIGARIGFRGESTEESPANPAIRIIREDKVIREVPAARPSETSVRWEAGITLSEPGNYRIQAFNESDPEKPGPSLPVTVLPPPSETDELSADPEFLRAFAELSGGRLIEEHEISEIVSLLSTREKQIERSKAVWDPAWDHWWCFSIVLFIASVEWFTRRRSGLL
ncbi:MAG: hypothetical protein CMO55_19690 [Verrucomicrobiales bacterium]|nr:hypothetical protein [Verrucomicrobiales bacterium]